MHVFHHTKMIHILVLTIMIVLIGSATSCGGPSARKSVVGYNASSNVISVVSVTGIQAYTKGAGPQDLSWGLLTSRGYKSMETRRELNIRYPIIIRWMDGRLDDYHAQYPDAKTAVIDSFQGLPPEMTTIKDEASLVLIFTNDGWKGFYVSGKSGAYLRESDILSLIAQRPIINMHAEQENEPSP